MSENFHKHMIDRARKLRRASTEPEKKLWNCLRNHSFAGISFRRQRPIGPYVVDFCCLEKKLVIELDGETHDFTEEKDAERTTYLESLGFRVVRFTNDDVFDNIDGVLKTIAEVLEIDWVDVWKERAST